MSDTDSAGPKVVEGGINPKRWSRVLGGGSYLSRDGDRWTFRLPVNLDTPGSPVVVLVATDLAGAAPRVVSVTVEQVRDGREVRGSDLRAFSVDDVLELAVKVRAWLSVQLGATDLDPQTFPDVARAAGAAAVKSVREGRKRAGRVTPERLAAVARVWSQAPAHRRTAAVAESEQVSLRQAGTLVSRCRDVGLISDGAK